MLAEWMGQVAGVLPEAVSIPAEIIKAEGEEISPAPPVVPEGVLSLPGGKAAGLDECGEGMESATVSLLGGGGMEGAGVRLERSLPIGGPAPRKVPPLPREDPSPEPVRRRGGASGGFRRNPPVGEALAALSQPFEEPSKAEAAAKALRGRRPGRTDNTLRRPSDELSPPMFTPQQRLLLLDTWTRSGLPAGDFAALVGASKQTLYSWKRRFEAQGPAGLEDGPRGGLSARSLPEITKRAILMLKKSHPEYGCERISDLLARGPALPASAASVAKTLHEAGYETKDVPTHRHPDKIRRFERASPNSLWQTDLFTFVLKRQNRRLHLIAFMDDHSRFIVGWGLFSSPSTELAVETLKAAVASFQAPEELLTDNGPQYVTWRGKSKFHEACLTLGVKQVVARPRRPQTLGKVERFWGTLWREFLGAAIFADVADARSRIGKFVDYYNFQRPHQGLDGLSPADRYFGKAEEVKAALRQRMAENAEWLARKEAEADENFQPSDGDVSESLTPDGSLPVNPVVDLIPGPGFDALTEGLSAAVVVGGLEAGHEK